MNLSPFKVTRQLPKAELIIAGTTGAIFGVFGYFATKKIYSFLN